MFLFNPCLDRGSFVIRVMETGLEGALLLEPQVFGDERGFFFESYNRRDLEQVLGSTTEFVQDNHSRSAKHVLRGLHYQVCQPQGKLVRVLLGRVFDVIVDLRRSSAGFGKWFGSELSAADKRILWVPPGFAHGFLVLSDYAEFFYKTTDYYAPEYERAIAWNDTDIGIDWPLDGTPILSAKDASAGPLSKAETYG